MSTIVGIFKTFMSMINFMLSWVEHEKSYITLALSASILVHPEYWHWCSAHNCRCILRFKFLTLVYDSLFLKTYAVYLQGPIYNETALANYADKDFFERNKTKVLAQRFGTVEEVYLTLWGPETSKRVLWQTAKTQMKCRIRRHFIWVFTVCFWRQNLSY